MSTLDFVEDQRIRRGVAGLHLAFECHFILSSHPPLSTVCEPITTPSIRNISYSADCRTLVTLFCTALLPSAPILFKHTQHGQDKDAGHLWAHRCETRWRNQRDGRPATIDRRQLLQQERTRTRSASLAYVRGYREHRGTKAIRHFCWNGPTFWRSYTEKPVETKEKFDLTSTRATERQRNERQSPYGHEPV
jgi:hypothetical protein